MKTSQKGIDLIKHFEGCRLKAYRDIIGVWTIGYGHTGLDVSPNLVINQEQAESLLKKDLVNFEENLSKMITTELNQNQFDAIMDFTYNVGLGNFQRSTLCKKINERNFKAATDQFERWSRAGGNVIPNLIKRRTKEKELFTS